MNTETIFLVAVAAMVAVAVSVPFVAPSPAADSESVDVETPDAPSVPAEAGTATVDGKQYESVTAAAANATPGDTVVLSGTFEEQAAILTDDITVTSGEEGAVIDGGGEGHVLNVTGSNVTVSDVWIRNSGYDTGTDDAGVFVDGEGATLQNLHVTDILWGIYVHGVDDVTVEDSYIEGREDILPLAERGNGIHLWETDDTLVENVTITTVRDGIYYSWANDVETRNSTITQSRYGVHFMYSDGNRMVDNTAVDNDVGYALMVSKDLEIVGNEALRNTGSSGHGILVKDVDHSTVRDNVVGENKNGIYVYNSNGNDILSNHIVNNDVGLETTAGSERQQVHGNSFLDNEVPAVSTTTSGVEAWNSTDRGNYWSSASTVDVTGDGVSDVRYRPQGIVEHVTNEHPQSEVFADSPAFDAVRLAESSFPVVESPGIVDHHPLVEPPHNTTRTAERD